MCAGRDNHLPSPLYITVPLPAGLGSPLPRRDETHRDHGARGGFRGGAEMVHGTVLNTFWSRNSIRPAFNDFDSKSGSKYIVPAAPAPSKTCQFRRLQPWLRLCTPIEKDGPGSNDAVFLTQGLTFMKTEYRRGVVLVRCFFLVIYLLRFFIIMASDLAGR